MATATSSVTGVSTLDVNSIVSQLMVLEHRPIDLLDTKEAGIQAQVSAYGSLKGSISSFQIAMQSMTLAKFTSSTISASDVTVFSASASTSTPSGTYDLNVTQTALSHVVQSAGIASDLSSGSTGTVSLQVGTGAIKTITLDSSNNTLRGLRDAINGADAGMQASIVNDGSAYRLVLTANTSGSANTVSVTNTLSAGPLKDALDGVTQARPAQNAQFTVNGVAISSPTNTVTTAISGVTLNLAKAGTSTLTIARDTSQAQAAVQTFVAAYNTLQQTVTNLTKYDPATNTAAVLNGDSSPTSSLNSVRSEMGSALTGGNGKFASLSQIGVSFQVDGTLALDAGKLSTALNTAPNDVAALFARQGNSDNALISSVSSTDATATGNWQVDVTAAATHGAATANTTPAATTVIDDTNDGFSIKIDGVDSGPLKLVHGSYTPAQLALLMQNTLNGSTSLSAAHVEVAVALDGAGKVRIESQSYGSASIVGGTGGTATGTAALALGFDGTETGAGTDVAGTFTLNGGVFTATGLGQTLTGPKGGLAEGLSLKFTGTASQIAAGNDANVSVSEGHAVRLARLATQALDTNGLVQSHTDGLAATIKDIDNQRDAQNTRLVGVEARLRAQYVALDSLMTSMSSTSSFLTQELANIPTSK